MEQEGIRRARQEIERADHLLLVIDSTGEQDADTILQQSFGEMRARLPAMSIVMNKSDLSGLAPGTVHDTPIPTVAVSALTGAGMNALREHLKHVVGYQGISGGDFSARRRHLDAMDRTESALLAGAAQLREFAAGELLAEHLRLAQHSLGGDHRRVQRRRPARAHLHELLHRQVSLFPAPRQAVEKLRAARVSLRRFDHRHRKPRKRSPGPTHARHGLRGAFNAPYHSGNLLY